MTTNYSYYTIPLIFLQPLFSSLRGPLIRLGVDNNANPRTVLDTLEKSGKYSPNLIAKLRRRESSEKNLWEGMPMILAAIVAGNTAGLSAQWMNLISIGYFVTRCAYIFAYIKISDKKLSFVRSGLWWLANACSLVTFVRSGNALNRKLL